MTTYTSEPGVRLGGRYRLEDRIAAGAGWAAWKAIDETLARAVTVFTFAQGFPRVAEVATAARAASRLTDPRLAQVFDVEDAWDHAYVVMEWAAGETLGDMLSHGPLEPNRAGRMIAEASAALSSAHAAGVAHMCLSPGSVRWSPTGEVKVVGLGIDAALSGTAADDPVVADTLGLGRLLYAALTAHWPGADYSLLPAAPLDDGRPCSPRQVIAGVPMALSELTCRAMQLPARDGASPLTTPDQLARGLLAALPPVPLLAPPPRHSAQGREDRRSRAQAPGQSRVPEYDDIDSYGGRDESGAGMLPGFGDGSDFGRPSDFGERPGAGRHQGPYEHVGAGQVRRLRSILAWRSPRADDETGQLRHRREALGFRGSLTSRLPIGVVAGTGALALIVIAAVALWAGHGGRGPSNHKATGPKSPTASAVVVLKPVGASGFDPLTSVQNDPGNEDSQTAPYAIDQNPKTSWDSQWYLSPEFGGLKSGSGLIIDMGKAVKFRSVNVLFGSTPGADVQLLVGNSNARSQANLQSMTTVGSATSPTGLHTFTVNSSVSGRYLVIWYTKLPPDPSHPGRYMAQVFDVLIKGIG